jgi:hypothetical protein
LSGSPKLLFPTFANFVLFKFNSSVFIGVPPRELPRSQESLGGFRGFAENLEKT